MNKVMNEENRRRGGRNTLCRLLRSGRWFLCLALLCSVMLPGFASAAATDAFCENLDSSGDINLTMQFPPSVSFAPGADFPPYTSPPAHVKYRCTDSGQQTVAITLLGDLSPLTDALKKTGLQMEVKVTDSSGGGESTWLFTGAQNKIDHITIGTPYTGDTTVRTMTIRMTVSRDPSAPIPAPGFYAIPSLQAFKLNSHYGRYNGPAIITPSLRLQYVPKCFVKTSLNTNKINFGPVMTTDVDSSFSRKDNFTVTADVNPNCNSGQFGNLQKDYTVSLSGGSKTFYLDLPLKVSFMLNNGGELSSDNKSIILHNPEGNNNGLQLRITDNNNIPVTFGETSLPDNKFGHFQGGPGGGTWNISNTYNAVLFPTGDPVKTGKYSAQVTVKVEYY
ncbi:fimbrial protein [Salmonella enterica]|nr:fimbrial protein [Salmonella enterica]